MSKSKLKEITIKISEKEMDAIEDAFFIELEDREEYEKTILPLLRRVWRKLCIAVDKYDERIK
jgi:hypothetical protein